MLHQLLQFVYFDSWSYGGTFIVFCRLPSSGVQGHAYLWMLDGFHVRAACSICGLSGNPPFRSTFLLGIDLSGYGQFLACFIVSNLATSLSSQTDILLYMLELGFPLFDYWFLLCDQFAINRLLSLIVRVLSLLVQAIFWSLTSL